MFFIADGGDHNELPPFTSIHLSSSPRRLRLGAVDQITRGGRCSAVQPSSAAQKLAESIDGQPIKRLRGPRRRIPVPRGAWTR